MKNLHKKALRALQEVAKEVQKSDRPYSIMEDGKITRVIPKKNSYKFFENKSCKFYPCHKDLEEINCLFCYCPLFNWRKCIKKIDWCKCESCLFPHKAENYKKIIKMLV